MSFPDRLRELMRERALSYRELARRAGMVHSTVHRILNKGETPHLSTIRKLAVALRVTPVELLDGDDES